MIVHCPHCVTGFELPEALLGTGGARVRCPTCEGSFVVLPAEQGGPKQRDAARQDARGAVSEATPGAPSGRAGAPVAPPAPGGMGAPGPPIASAAGEPPREDPARVAGAVLDVLTDFLGEALTRSRARGTVLSDHGPAILAVWDEYRRRAGADAPSRVFRAALREHCGVDLVHASPS